MTIQKIDSSTLPKGRYLITGGAGFIGSHLSERLLTLGCEVLVIDNFLTGRPENIRPFLGNPKFTLIEKDIVQNFQVEGALAGIFHMASPASPVDYAKFPIETLHVGALGTDHVLKLALQKKCRVLVASTSEIYGDPLEHPQQESYWGNVNTIGPRGCYDESKRYLEALTMAYHRVHKLETRMIRIFNTYGPRMRTDDGRVVPNFCIQAAMNKDMTVYGDGSQTRSFCYVDDLVEGIIRVIQCGFHEPINLGNPNETTILEFAKRIQAFAGSTGKIVSKELPQDDPKTRCPDITRAKEILGWVPRVGLDEGLATTYQYFKSKAGL